jgi:hypothetical protein
MIEFRLLACVADARYVGDAIGAVARVEATRQYVPLILYVVNKIFYAVSPLPELILPAVCFAQHVIACDKQASELGYKLVVCHVAWRCASALLLCSAHANLHFTSEDMKAFK